MRLLNKSKLKIQSKVLKTFQYPPLFGPMRFMMPFCWSNFKLYFTPRSRRTHTTPRQVWRRLLQESRRIPRTARHLQGSLHHQSAQPPYRPACCRHGFACRPHRRRQPFGTYPSVRSYRHGKPDACSGRSTSRHGQSR